jgi:hypothetical protein
MPRAIRYYIEDTPENQISNGAWKEITRLQHWYNSEFIWSCDRIALKRYILFPNYDRIPDMPYTTARFHFRKRLLQKKIELQDEIAAVHAMVEEGLFDVRWGGVRDNSIASGISRVAGNEFNAYLVCEFLLKCSVIATEATFVAEDEGRFILTGRAMFRNGAILVNRSDLFPNGASEHDVPLDIPQIFSVVNPARYDEHPRFTQNVEDFGELGEEEITASASDYKALGFAQNYETAWGDAEGLNLQQRARKVVLV